MRLASVQTPPTLPDKNWTVHVFNANDQILVDVNGVNAATVNGLGASNGGDVSINSLLNATDNIIRFRVFNNDQNNPFFFLSSPYFLSPESIPNGFGWGIELKADGQVIYRDIRGNAQSRNVINANNSISVVPAFPANRGASLTGLVYDQTLTINKNARTPGTGTYTVRAYNTSDISMVRVNVDNVAMSLDATSPFEAFATLDSLLNFNGINDINFQVFTSPMTHPFPLTDPNQPLRDTVTWGFDVLHGDTLIYRNRDGQREGLTIDANGKRFPSGARFNRLEECCGFQVLNDHFNPFID